MDLQQLLDYREKCIICQKTMIYKFAGGPRLKVSPTSKGLQIRSGHKHGIRYHFKFDGTYTRGIKWYDIYAAPIGVTKHCPTCRSDVSPGTLGSIIRLKSRSVGMTTMTGALTTYMNAHSSLDNIKKQGCSYSFYFYGDSKGNYDIKQTTEYIRYCNDEEFYHINTDFMKGSTLHHARFEDNLADTLTLHIPVANMSAVKNIDQLINKFKLYTLFS